MARARHAQRGAAMVIRAVVWTLFILVCGYAATCESLVPTAIAAIVALGLVLDFLLNDGDDDD